MRVSVEHNTETPDPAGAPVDPSAPDLSFLTRDVAGALQSFFGTMQRITADNPVDIPRLMTLGAKAKGGQAAADELAELQSLKVQALRQGRAAGAVIGFFLKFKPYPALAEIRGRAKLFQPAFGPLLVVDGDTVRDVFARHQEFTVDPYGVEMVKTMTPAHNGGFSTFVLSTDDTTVYDPDKRLLTTVCTREDADTLTAIVHDDCMRRVGAAVASSRANGAPVIDVVSSVARFVPVTVGHRYLGVPVADRPGSFELTDEMLTYYGSPIDGQPETALAADDGVIPDERQMYLWIKSAFQHFFNNVQKDPVVQIQGLRSCRQLLAYLLREIDIQRERLLDGGPVDDTMLTRLLRLQMNLPVPSIARPADLDPKLVSDLRIAENVMGTIVGAIAGQEEATCRVVDSLIRLQEGEFKTSGSSQSRYGTFAEAKSLAQNILNGTNAAESRALLRQYVMEGLRLQPQGEVLLRKCAVDGATIADSRPIAAGTLVFVSHGSAMQDIPEPDAFILGRPREHYLHYGWNRHTCLGQHVSPVIITESVAALLGLQDLARPAAQPDQPSFPFERRFGRFQLDDQNLYATTFTLQFSDSGSTAQYWPAPAIH